ncbi:hypothetical protein P4475_17785 [Halalkalibacterium halodurans]|uniref:hypothetical protein n=1 Tax=Halalkalibacterium halodurans TaxID=86665 RepID=UPI001067FB0F|nr:hypothetical protein [Halalkalibacterium halodurans]MED3648624.1 hypothetical protein [Halalkalibacterium halodurans]TES47606.1 hypothetical protein E2L07_18695 [Halalkalibacterium halodurans]
MDYYEKWTPWEIEKYNHDLKNGGRKRWERYEQKTGVVTTSKYEIKSERETAIALYERFGELLKEHGHHDLLHINEKILNELRG